MIEIMYWVLLVVWLAFGLYRERDTFIGGGLLQFILFVLLGLAVFHNPLTR